MENVTSVAALKASLSRILAAVKAGREFIVTDRGKPIARIAPCTPAEAGLDELVRAGVVRPASKPWQPGFLKAARPEDPDARLLGALLAEREEGR